MECTPRVLEARGISEARLFEGIASDPVRGRTRTFHMPPADATHQTELGRFVAAPPGLVWALAADTNRWDRSLGLAPSRYQVEAGRDGAPLRVGHSRHGGVPVAWTEHGEWVEGRSLWGERRFLRPGRMRFGYRVTVERAAGGAQLTAGAYVVARGRRGQLVARLWTWRFRRALGRFVASIERAVAALGVASDATAAAVPAAQWAARLLRAAPPIDRRMSGVSARANLAVLAGRAKVFAAAGPHPVARDRLVELLRARPDDDLRQLRPFELAAEWQLDRRAVLEAFLLAARAGLVDLVWQLNCPSCRVAADVATRLDGIAPRVHCDFCAIDFDTDFGENVEAVFCPSPGVRKVEPEVYCSGSPWFRPHVFAVLVLAPGESRVLEHLPEGAAQVRALGCGRVLPLPDGARGGAVTVDEDGPRHAPGLGPLAIGNASGRELTVLVERAGWSADIVRGSVLASCPGFLAAFGAEAPAVGRELRVGTLAVLFVDLVSSTALYERYGDARAYAAVQEHAASAARIIAEHGGAIVKTLGDGLLASFPAVGPAVAAGLDLTAAAAAVGQRLGMPGLAVRVGVNAGPCFLVGVDGRIDLFGTTVNVAARLEAEAPPGQVAVLAEALDQPDARAVLVGRAAGVTRASRRLRGLAGSFTVATVAPVGAAPVAARADSRPAS
jgi:class 3 adenylate cyclase